MGIVLGPNRYGKAENRVVRIYRDTARHEIRDLNVSTSLRGDFDDAHVDGDQSHVLPTDTQKNTAFAYAKQHGVTSPGGLRDRAGDPAPPRHPGRHRSPGRGGGVRRGTGSPSTARAMTTRSSGGTAGSGPPRST